MTISHTDLTTEIVRQYNLEPYAVYGYIASLTLAVPDSNLYRNGWFSDKGAAAVRMRFGAASVSCPCSPYPGVAMAAGGGIAAGSIAAGGGVAIGSTIGDLFLMLFGFMFCLTLIGAIVGIPMIISGIAMMGTGAAAGTAIAAGGSAVGAATMTAGAVAYQQQQRQIRS
jgi:hypothetical protein